MGKINMHDFIRAHGLPGPKRITPEHTNQGPIIKLIKREEGRLKIVTTNPTPTTRVA